jgi:hypothetical protein
MLKTEKYVFSMDKSVVLTQRTFSGIWIKYRVARRTA